MSPDKCDPLMMLNTAKDMGDHSAPVASGEASRQPADVAKFDSAAIPGYVTVEIPGVGEKPLTTSGIQRQPADVDRFNSGV